MTTQTAPSEAEKQAARREYLGGSDAAAVLGLSRWKTPLQLWAEKTGNIVPEDRSQSLPIRLGNRLEQVVAELFEEETGLQVRRITESQTHPKYPFLRAQIDRRIVGADEILEIKTASGFKAKEWEDDQIPAEYILQCLHQLAVTGKQRCHLACLIGGNQDFVRKVVERDDAAIADLVRKEVEFWERYVVPRQMPAVTADDAPTLYGLFPKGAEDVQADLSGHETTVARIKELDDQLAALEAEKEQHRNELRAALKDATLGTAGKWKISWKNQSTGVRLDTDRIKAEAPEVYERFGKAGETRMLRISEIKPPKAKKEAK